MNKLKSEPILDDKIMNLAKSFVDMADDSEGVEKLIAKLNEWLDFSTKELALKNIFDFRLCDKNHLEKLGDRLCEILCDNSVKSITSTLAASVCFLGEHGVSGDDVEALLLPKNKNQEEMKLIVESIQLKHNFPIFSMDFNFNNKEL
jgi:hypothetical protein